MLEDDKAETVCCGICGGGHDTNGCSELIIKDHVFDKIAPSKARLTLPDKLRLETLSDASHTIEANVSIIRGTKFGPYDAKRVFSISPQIQFPLKIFACDDYFKEYYLDNSNELVCNWMYFVKPASCLNEQNLICIQDNNELYYITTRDLLKGEQLYVWYGPHYSKLMDQELLSIQTSEDNEENPISNSDLDEIVQNQVDLVKRESWLCKFCDMQESSLPKFTEHILIHYKHKMRRCCELCKSSFNTKMALAKHIRLDHAPHQNIMSLLSSPINITSKTSNTDSIPNTTHQDDFAPGGPLLGLKSDENTAADDMFTASILNMRDTSNSVDISVEGRSALMELDAEMIEADDYLTRKFNFNVDDEGIVCDVCQRSFTKLKSLVLHLNKHTGKFYCNICGKVYARKENLINHGCQALNVHCYSCTITPNCKRSFRFMKQLKHHIRSIHNKEQTIFNSNSEVQDGNNSATEIINSTDVASGGLVEMYKKCVRCNTSFADAREEEVHICSTIAPTAIAKTNTKVLEDSIKHECSDCHKIFNKRSSLTRHIGNVHRNNSKNYSTGKVADAAPFMCAQCSKQFSNLRYLRDHHRTHGQKHVCKYCDKQFARLYTLKKHLNWHLSFKQEAISCSTCLRSFDDEQNLRLHMLEHMTNTTQPHPPARHLVTSKSSVSAVNVERSFDENVLTLIPNNKIVNSSNEHILFTSAIITPHDRVNIIDETISEITKSHHNENMEDDLQENVKIGDFTEKMNSVDLDEKQKLPKINANKECENNIKTDIHLSVNLNKSMTAASLPQNTSISDRIRCKQSDCNIVFSSSREMQDHYSVFHRRIFCSICKRRFSSNAAFVNHQTDSTCAPGSMVSCSYCDGRFKLKSSLVRHVRKKHTDKIEDIHSRRGTTLIKEPSTNPNKVVTSLEMKINKTSTVKEKCNNIRRDIYKQDKILSLSGTAEVNANNRFILPSSESSLETVLIRQINGRHISSNNDQILTMADASKTADTPESILNNSPDDIDSNLDYIAKTYESVVSENNRNYMMTKSNMEPINTYNSFHHNKFTSISKNVNSSNNSSTSKKLDISNGSSGDVIDTLPSTKPHKIGSTSTATTNVSSPDNCIPQQIDSVLDFTSLEMDFQIQGIDRAIDTARMQTRSISADLIASLSMPVLSDIEVEDRDGISKQIIEELDVRLK